VHFNYVFRSSALVQSVDVLGDHGAQHADLLHSCQSQVGRVGLRGLHAFSQWPQPVEKTLRFAAESGKRSHLHWVIFLPQAGFQRAEIWHSREYGNPRPGQDDKVAGFL
jgi:hypothetical protein